MQNSGLCPSIGAVDRILLRLLFQRVRTVMASTALMEVRNAAQISPKRRTKALSHNNAQSTDVLRCDRTFSPEFPTVAWHSLPGHSNGQKLSEEDTRSMPTSVSFGLKLRTFAVTRYSASHSAYSVLYHCRSENNAEGTIWALDYYMAIIVASHCSDGGSFIVILANLSSGLCGRLYCAAISVWRGAREAHCIRLLVELDSLTLTFIKSIQIWRKAVQQVLLPYWCIALHEALKLQAGILISRCGSLKKVQTGVPHVWWTAHKCL